MKTPHIRHEFCRSGRRCRHWAQRLIIATCLPGLLALGISGRAAPLADLSFSEGSGTTTANAGSLADTGTFAQQNSLPAFSTSTPSGPYAPAGNTSSVDFGPIAAGEGNRAIDFPTPLGAMTAFTVAGWVNCRDLTVGSGGNRITFALETPNGRGLDLVQLADGSLRLGINQWPDASGGGGPFSSTGKITADASAGAANWVFLAVTYDSTLPNGQVKYYFGNADTPASLDVARDHNRGAIVASGTLTLGNFGTVVTARADTANSRVFRGLMDEVKVFTEALSLEKILTAQTNGVVTATLASFLTEPADQTVFVGDDATFTALAVGTMPIAYQWQRDNADIPGATESSYTVVASTVGDNHAQFRVVVTNPAGTTTSSNATLRVTTDNTPPTVVAVVNPDLTTLRVTFSEPVEQNTAEDLFGYYFESGVLGVYTVTLQADLTNVVLTTDPMTPSQTYTLTIEGVRDRAVPPNPMVRVDWPFTAAEPPPFPPPLVTVRLNEGTGTITTNSGSLGGILNLSTPVPTWAVNVPGNAGGARSVDFGTTTGNYFVEAPAVYPELAGLTQFSIAGWVNNRSSTIGNGGNRIVTWNSPNSDGVDLVYLADGSLQVGINQWPDGVPSRSSAGRITTDANAGLDNWRFFAVTYDSTLPSSQVKFYFGSAADDATFDVETTYPRGAVGTNIKPLVLGHFNNTTRPNALDRMFRGLIDEVQIFNEALTLDEVVAVQRANEEVTPLAWVSEPADQIVLAGDSVTFEAVVTGGFPIGYQWQRDNVDILGATGARYTLDPAVAGDNGAQFRVIVTNPLGQLTSSNATLTVITDITPPTVVAVETTRSLTTLIVSFSEPVEENSATDLFAYYFASDPLGVTDVELQANLTNVTLTTEAMTPGQGYTLTIENVRDRAFPLPNTMAPTNWLFTAYTPPPRTNALVEVRFEEGSGLSVANTGTAGGAGTIDEGVATSAPGLPAFTNNVPLGPYAPSGNQWSLYNGTGAGHGQYAGQAVDFPDDVRLATVALEEFTVAGWINVTDGTIGSGGNRIFTTWPQNVDGLNANRLTGVDVVVAANGTLRLGVNMAPDYPTPPGNIGPTSSASKVPISADAAPANWVFFAVTYNVNEPLEKARFYFGDGQNPATLDVVSNYNRGTITNCSAPVTLTLANFMDSPPLTTTRDSTSNSRAFRGLMDEIRFFGNALTLAEIQEVQIRGAGAVNYPAGLSSHPADQSTFAGQPVTFSVTATGTPPVSVQWQRDGQNLPGASGPSYTLPAVTDADDGAVFRAVVSNDYGSETSSSATLTVWPEDGLKLRFAFEEGSGLTTTNLGNLQGYGTFVQQTDYPVFSSNVPLGVHAPSATAGSVDFGTIAAGQGARAIDWGNGLTPALGVMQGFTACGWLNARELTVGSGGNRIIFALDAANGRGFDLVQLADGSLRLGVNQWPDGSGGGGPISSIGKITADVNAGPDNWVFFAVTYDSMLANEQVKYYFGAPEFPVELDVAGDYLNRGAIVATGPPTLGNFGAVVSARNDVNNSRVFRGLMDDIQIHNRVLSLEELGRVQRGLPPGAGPTLAMVREGAQAVISWTSTATFQLVYKDQLEAATWTPVSETVDTVGDLHTVRVNADQPMRFYRLEQ